MPEDKRVAGNARLNVAGSSAEPVADRRDRGSLVDGGELAELTRRPARITATKDLSVSLRSSGRSGGVGRVLNLCEGGMLVSTSSDLEVAEIANFELAGPDFRYAGLATVAHRQQRATGLRFLSWDGPVERPIRALVAARGHQQQPGSHDPGKSTHPAIWDSRAHDRATVDGLSAVIEESRGATTSRHHVLNVSEHGMLIDGLALPIGARITFLLAGRGLNHVARGRVAHHTDTAAGFAIDLWHGAPEAIRALISGQTERGPRVADTAYITDWS